jgi:hypothetical protein
MNSIVLYRLFKAAPFAMAIFSILLLAHGFHFNPSGDPGGSGAPNIRFVLNGDPGGSGAPN